MADRLDNILFGEVVEEQEQQQAKYPYRLNVKKAQTGTTKEGKT